VVLLPGTLGSVLVDQSLTPTQAREECRRNLGPDRDRRWRAKPWYPCDKRPETLWGAVGSLHWFFSPDRWLQRLTRGNGYDQGVPVRADSLVDIDLVVWGQRVQVRPYAALLKALGDAGADVLVVPYDWRLSNRHNAVLVERRVLERWFGGRPPPRGRRLRDDERVTFIGHSMGGLVARCLLESRPLGPVLGRRLITIGTPHRGAPVAYLHLIGRTHPFPESPFAAGAHATLVREARAAGAALRGELAAQLVPGRVQTALVRFMGSAFELLPSYNFVRNRGATEPWPDTYAKQVHQPTGEPAVRLVRRLRASMVDERALDAWLRARGLEYHLLGATGFKTVLGYDRGRDRLLTGSEGDGTVPLASARPRPTSTANLRLWTLTGERGLGHQNLCQRHDVQAYCLNVLGLGRTAVGAGVAGVEDPQVEDFVAMAKVTLKAAPPYRGVVLSVVRLAGDGQLIDTTTEASRTSPRRRLKHPPRHLSSPEIFEVWSPRLRRTFRYVWILSNEQATHPVGGMLVLPASWERDVHLVTFNVGNLDDRYQNRCRNAHHAEMQLIRWVEEQPASWRARLRTVHVANRSRSTGVRGYSPCNACCADLVRFLAALKALSGRPVDARISWLELYTKGGICGHPTDRANLDRLRAGGWQLDGPLPAPPSPARAGTILAGGGVGPRFAGDARR
jgi:pimeloyl-ACP methyl ester carboxylesterase